MIFRITGCSGCFGIIILLFLLMVLFKSWFFILLLVLLMMYSGNITKWIKNFKDYLSKPKEYKSKMGKVYKQCRFCETKTDKSAIICPKCEHPL